MKSSAARLKQPGVAGLLLLLIGVCIVSMAGVATFYHLALGRVAQSASESSAAMQDELSSSHALVESLELTQNTLQKLLRQRDPDILETLVADLQERQNDLSRRLAAMGERGRLVRSEFDTWNAVCGQIVETSLRGENAEANSDLVNRLMPQSEKVLNEVRKINQASERQAMARRQMMRDDIARTRQDAMGGVALAAVFVLVGGLLLRKYVARGAGAVTALLGRMTSLSEANEALEERVRERTAEIERSNAQMAALHQSSLDCVLVLDDQWRIGEFNAAAERAFRCNRNNAFGRSIAQFVAFAGENRGEINIAHRGHFLGRQIEVLARRPDGSTFSAEMAITAAEFDGPALYIVFLRDISERKRAQAERDELNNRLLAASRQAGMAEVATGVLHNVGNVLNSVNVSANVVANTLRQSEVSSLIRVGEMITAHEQDLAAFLTSDERGKVVPRFIADLAQCMSEEQSLMLKELLNLSRGIEHIKQTVSAQQWLAKKGSVLTAIDPVRLMETALTMQGGAMARHEIEIVREFQSLPEIQLDTHKVLQILINLIGNAKQAVKAGQNTPRQIKLVVATARGDTGELVRFGVIDNGVGIAPENLTRIFGHGFTTKPEGHGFGLHSSANAARELGGLLTATSEGLGRGAAFTLELPIEVNKEQPCSL